MIKYDFMIQTIRVLNSGQSKSVVLTGNIYDLFFSSSQKDSSKGESLDGEYTPLLEYFLSRWEKNSRFIKIVYGFNQPVKFVDEENLKLMREAWVKFRTGADENYLKIKRLAGNLSEEEKGVAKGEFDKMVMDTAVAPTFSLEVLKRLCEVSRMKINGKPILEKDLVIIIDGADMILPQGEIARLSEADRQRISICRDWFSDPEFTNANDSVILIAESKSKLNEEVARLPQVLEVEISSPNKEHREAFISWFFENQKKIGKPEPKLLGSQEELAIQTAGLSIQALMQLLKGCVYSKKALEPKDVTVKVEQFIQGQLGEGVVEFFRPQHTLNDVIGNRKLKKFLISKLLPRFKKRGKSALVGAAIAGPNRAGKSFIFEGFVSMLDMVVLVLKNIRSMWFGQTDVIFGRLRRLLIALDRVSIFMDEADTQMGGVGADTHPTERRLTGNIQNMMSDPKLRGKVFWFLLTARIHLLSPDLRQPGRVGDLMIPVLDPEGDDLEEFVEWTVKSVINEPSKKLLKEIKYLTEGYSAGAFDALRRELKAVAGDKKSGKLAEEEILEIANDLIMPEFKRTRRVQALYALINCTRKSLIPFEGFESLTKEKLDEQREDWRNELAELGEVSVE